MTHDRTTHSPVAVHPTGPARFQQLDAVPPERHTARALGAAVVLLALVVGVPAGLVLLDALPAIPTSLPTREQLTATIGTEQVLAVLVWVAWLAWLQFTLCVLVELRSALSGIGLPTRVPLAGPSQRVARSLVVAVLMLITTVGPASAIAPEIAHVPQVGTVATSVAFTSPQTALPQVGAPLAAPVPQASGPATYLLGDVVLDADDGAALVGQHVYVVQPPEGRYHDNLWDIAERTLGDGRRYQEIYELNKGRPQPDGQELSLARLIQPNWLLVMPADAVGAQQVVAVQAPAAPEAPTTAAPGAPAAAPVQGAAVAAAASGVAADQAGSFAAPEAADQGDSTRQLLGAGLLAAGLLAAIDGLRRRRRTPEPSHSAVEVEVALRVAASPGRAKLLDTGLRHLATTLRATGRDLPGVYAARVDDHTVTLVLAPADPDAPAPWRADDGGRRWVLDVEPPTRAHARGPAPFPGLVSLGRDVDDADILIDLEAAQGPIAVVGDPAAALELVTALAVELATNTWSDALAVTGVDLPAAVTDLGLDRYQAADTVTAALPALAERRTATLGAGVLSGRLAAGGAGAWIPRYLVIGSTPEPAIVPALLELTTTDVRAPLGLVCVGDLPGARWRLEVDDAGSVNIAVLGMEVRANRLTAAQVACVAELLTPTPVDDDAQGAAAGHEAVLDRPEVLPPAHPVDRAAYIAAPVRVQVFGAPRVHAAGPIDPERVALATELVVFLALHPDGVHPNVLAAALWPRGVTPEVRDATIARTREWLGLDDGGTPHLRDTGDGRLCLGKGAVVDWDVVRTLLVTARTVGETAKERRLTAAALKFAAGPVLAERPPGRYAWLARVRLERASRDVLVDAAHRLAILCRHDDDPAGAREAAFAGLWVSPTEELLWRDVLRATAASGDQPAVRGAVDDMLASLRAAGVAEVAAPTAALIEELAPGYPLPADQVGTA